MAKAFFFTFPGKFRYHAHPTNALIHPDGYFTVMAADKVDAARKLESQVGQVWSMAYSELPPRELFPLGSLTTIN